MAFCAQCGNSFNEADLYCNKCGKGINDLAAPPSNYSNPSGNSNLAMWAHLAPLIILGLTVVLSFTGIGAVFALFAWLPALLIMNNQNADDFTRQHAKESLNFQLFWLVAGIVLVIGSLIFAVFTLGIGLIIVIPVFIGIGIFQLVVMIQAISAATSGRSYSYPGVFLKFVK